MTNTIKYLKRGEDFSGTYLDENFQYHIYGIDTTNLKKNDKIYLDLCMFKNDHTYIEGEIIRVYKYSIIIQYRYI